jgi:zinc/manganese transport system permease protein
MIDFLALPALACAALVGIHAYFGLHVLKRNVIFVDLALAQVAALGATVAFMLGHAPQSLAAYAWSLGFALAAAVLLACTRRWSGRVPQEAQIGVIYVVAAGAALLLVDQAPQGAEHIRQILVGNILTVSWEDVRNAIALYAAVGIVHPLLARRLREGWFAEFAFYAAFALVVTSSVALAGVLLVFAFLIIPAAIGVLYAESFRRQLVLAWIVGTVVAAAGLVVSFQGNYSTGATLVCAYGAALAIAGLARLPRLFAALAGVTAGILAISGVLVLALPRADQPVLDAAELAMPRLKEAYMDEKALRIAEEAERYAERYRGEAEAVRAREAERRWKGEPLDELEVRKVASFLKSYNEMIRGETFVAREVRSRAREAQRGWIGAALLLAAALVIGVPYGVARSLRGAK